MRFARLKGRDVVADFGGGAMTPDTDALLLGVTRGTKKGVKAREMLRNAGGAAYRSGQRASTSLSASISTNRSATKGYARDS